MGKVNHYSGGEPIKEAASKTEKFAKGGLKRKRGGTCDNDMPPKRLDKRARGGGVLSTASNVKGRLGGRYDSTRTDKEDD